MKVFGKSTNEVEINPIDVINGLLKEYIPTNGWLDFDDLKFYICYEGSFGHTDHKPTEKKEITKELFEYLTQLTNIKNFLNKQTI